MNFLAGLAPGDAAFRVVLMVLAQTSIAIASAALLGRFAFRRRADARHALWLGVLAWVSISPAVATVADRSHFAPRAIALPFPGPALGDIALIAAFAVDQPPDQSGAVATGPDRQATAAPPLPFHPDNRGTAPSPLSGGPRPRLVPSGSALAGGLALLWAAGALAGLARIVAGCRRLAAFGDATRPLDSARHADALNQARQALGVRDLPPIVTSPTARGPVAVGLLRPRVVLPDGLAEAISRDALRDVLVHESAHVIRLDLWVGLLQRLASALFWPHPLVHYMDIQLTRAREEVCDNHVLRCGDPRGYARTLLSLTEQCRPPGVARPGLGLLGARWTLADRVAGLLDPRRTSMIRTTFRTKIAVAVALAIAALAGLAVRFDRPARADAPKDPKPAVWNIEGIVIDERGKPVAGAVVHAELETDHTGSKTAHDGTFTLGMGDLLYTRMLVAEADDGARIGLARFDPARFMESKGLVRLVLKPVRTVLVRVRDAAGASIAGAAVEAFDYGAQFHATTAPSGVATLRVPADARIRGVIGLKSGAGFDYFENYRATPPNPLFEFPPLPAEFTLTLDGAQTVRIKVIDPDGRPLPGVVIVPWRPSKPGKIMTLDISRGATTAATTDARGVATFDWLPKWGPRERPSNGVRFFVRSTGNFFPPGEGLTYVPDGPSELTARLRRSARLTGTVRLPDGRPARQALVIAGSSYGGSATIGARTDDEGRYAFDRLGPGSAMMIAVNDEMWAAPSLISDVLKESQEQGGLDFTLSKGTLIHGRITEGPDHRPSPGARISLEEEGGLLPKELRTVSTRTFHLNRNTTADAQGRYQYRVGPGRFRLRMPGLDNGSEALTIEVKDQAEIVRDLETTKAPVREQFIQGVVMEKTATGERPAAGAWTFRWPVRGRHKADNEGKFLVDRDPGETIIYAYVPDKALAGFSRLLSSGADHVKVVLVPTATVTGRVIDSNGKPRANQRVGVRLSSGLERHFDFTVSAITTDAQGRFTYRDAPPGSMGELIVAHQQDASPNRGPHTVVPFEVRDADPIQALDLVVPADKPAN